MTRDELENFVAENVPEVVARNWINDLQRIRELEAELATIRRQASDATEYVLATINQEQANRIRELEKKLSRAEADVTYHKDRELMWLEKATKVKAENERLKDEIRQRDAWKASYERDIEVLEEALNAKREKQT